jgi:hypothetical protein
MAHGTYEIKPDAEVAQFARDAIDRYALYRDHKENLAYAGLAVYAAACGTVLISNDWPPKSWGDNAPNVAVVALVTLWVILLVYLKYQLRRRRWAALRVAGCEWILAGVLPSAPQTPKHKTTERFISEQMMPSCWSLVCDYVVPQQDAVSAVDRTLKVYPDPLVFFWTNAERHGTDALGHERIVQAAGWMLFVATIVRTVFGVR